MHFYRHVYRHASTYNAQLLEKWIPQSGIIDLLVIWHRLNAYLKKKKTSYRTDQLALCIIYRQTFLNFRVNIAPIFIGIPYSTVSLLLFNFTIVEHARFTFGAVTHDKMCQHSFINRYSIAAVWQPGSAV
jgi:hypothetical protein